jgi:hypothetical protein
VCFGKNKGVEGLTWFYTFRTAWKGIEFTKRAAAHPNPDISTVEWEMYSCEFMSVDETLANMEECVRVVEEVWGEPPTTDIIIMPTPNNVSEGEAK